MIPVSHTSNLLKKVAFLALGCALLGLFAENAHAQLPQAPPIYLADGNTHTATITYAPPPDSSSCTPGSTPNSGPCGSLTVVLDTRTVLTVPFNIAYIGPSTGGAAYVGFTGATGGCIEEQDILSWSLNNGSPVLGYPPFPASADSGLQTNGSATVLSDGTNFLQLTPSNFFEDGSAWYTTPVVVTGGFTTTFKFQLSPTAGTCPADGIAFVIQNSDAGTSALGAVGGSIGYTNITNSVAVEFDTFTNPGDIPASAASPSSTDELSVQSCGTNPNTSDHRATSGSGGEGVSCDFGGLDLSTVVIVQSFDPNGTIAVTDTFTTGTGTIVQNIVIPSTHNNPNGSNEISSTNSPIPTSTWPQYVVGTPWAISRCAAHLGNGTNLCSLYVNACWNSGTQTAAQASDAFCPTVDPNGDQGEITIEDTFDWTKQSIPNGTTVSLIAFSPPWTSGCNPVSITCNPYLQWAASSTSTNPVCTDILTPATTPCYLLDTLVDMFGDQTTTRGTSPKSKSWNVTAFDVPMPLTSVFAAASAAIVGGNAQCPLDSRSALNDPNPSDATYENPTFTAGRWFNGNCLVDFVVNQAAVPPSLMIPANGSIPANNNFVAGLPATLTYGSAVNADITPPLSNTSSASPWDTMTQLKGLTLGGLAGSYDAPAQSLNWSSVDTAGISEKNVQLNTTPNTTCPNPDTGTPDNEPCYTTTLFTTQVNLDSTAPTITTPTLTSSSPVTYSYTCADAGSGIATCGSASPALASVGPPPLGPATITVNDTTFPVVAGPHTVTVTATDLAGNTASSSVTYNVYGICALTQNIAVKAGATIPLKFYLCSGAQDVSSSSIVVHAVNLFQTSSSTSDPVIASGNANPDNDFRYDPTQGPSGGYIFNLKTTGLGSGGWVMQFTVAGDPTLHTLAFGVK
jgi:hypothetical protein